MDAIQTIFSSPLPVAISAIIAVACLLGYWFFVIPLLEDVKKLREANADLQLKLGDEFELQKANAQKFMQELTTSLQSQNNISELVAIVNSLKSSIDQQTNALNSNFKSLADEVQSSLENLNHALTQTSDTSSRKFDDIRREVERLGRLMESLTTKIMEVSDKQSQVTGVLTGMSIANMNRGV